MKVAMINTSDLQGGAAIAAFRLAEAYAGTKDIEVTMVVKEKRSNRDFVLHVNDSKLKHYRGFFNFAMEKASFLPYEASKDIRFFFSNPNFGQDISTIPAIRDADVLHLHWINKGYLSFHSLQRLFDLGKPILWTLHDMWAFTGGCHYAEHCDHFKQSCGSCFYLKNQGSQDLSNQIWLKKEKLYRGRNMHFVTCSRWLQQEAQSSGLLKDFPIHSIPNTIDTSVFKPLPSGEKSKKTILFQAMNINDKRKGLKYFLEALAILKKDHPDFAEQVQLLVFGKDTSGALDHLDYPVDYLGFLGSQGEIVAAYNRSDIFVIPSLSDNLPNTIMESMACGKPVVGFETGGIPEMVDHRKNGYIAPQKNVNELAAGIKWTLESEERYQELSKNALQKVQNSYTHQVIVDQYHYLYRSI